MVRSYGRNAPTGDPINPNGSKYSVAVKVTIGFVLANAVKANAVTKKIDIKKLLIFMGFISYLRNSAVLFAG